MAVLRGVVFFIEGQLQDGDGGEVFRAAGGFLAADDVGECGDEEIDIERGDGGTVDGGGGVTNHDGVKPLMMEGSGNDFKVGFGVHMREDPQITQSFHRR